MRDAEFGPVVTSEIGNIDQPDDIVEHAAERYVGNGYNHAICFVCLLAHMSDICSTLYQPTLTINHCVIESVGLQL